MNLTPAQCESIGALGAQDGAVDVQATVLEGLVGPVQVKLDDGTELLVLANGDVVASTSGVGWPE